MHTRIHEQNGYSFALVYGMLPGISGVMFDPRAANLNDPAWIEAYEAAVVTFRAVLPLVWLEWPAMAGMKYVDREDVDMYIAHAEEVLNNTEYPYTGEELETARRVRDELMSLKARKKPVAKPLIGSPGYVYLLQASTGVCKIGRTKDPSKRTKMLEVKLPFDVTLGALIKTDDMHNLEYSLHVRFGDKRVNGEWFNLEPEDIEYIKSLQGE